MLGEVFKVIHKDAARKSYVKIENNQVKKEREVWLLCQKCHHQKKMGSTRSFCEIREESKNKLEPEKTILRKKDQEIGLFAKGAREKKK